MTKFKKIVLPYDKNEAEMQRELFWKEQNKYKYPNRGVVSLDRIKECGDDGKFVDDLNDKIDTDLMLNKLTPRQREVIQLRMDGYTYKEIAKELGISVNTVKRHHTETNMALLGKNPS